MMKTRSAGLGHLRGKYLVHFHILVLGLFFATIITGCAHTPTTDERLASAERLIANHYYAEAANKLRPISNSDNPELGYLLGLIAFNRGQDASVIKLFLPLAEKGDERTYLPLATVYRRSGNFKESAFWLNKSSETGNPEGKLRFARACWEGQGVERDRKMTFKLIDEAAMSPDYRDKAMGWKEHFMFRLEMETGPEKIPPSKCIVYVNKPDLIDYRRDRVTTPWCDAGLDEQVSIAARNAVDNYLDKNYSSAYSYQLKAEYSQQSNGFLIRGNFNQWRGQRRVKILYGTGPAATSGFLTR